MLQSVTIIFLLIATFQMCKTDVEPTVRIKGGTIVTNHDFPYMVGLFFAWVRNISKPTEFHCGGVLISANKIVTAGHCTYGLKYFFISHPLVVGSGFINMDPFDATAQFRNVTRVYIHKDFDEKYLRNDISVIVLKIPFVLDGKTIKPIELYKGALSTGMMCQIHGWGSYGNPKMHVSPTLRTAEIPVIEKQICLTMYRKLYHENILTDKEFCASKKNIDSCNGDSGGPIVYKGKLVGITSFGPHCSSLEERSTVYTMVAPYMDILNNPESHTRLEMGIEFSMSLRLIKVNNMLLLVIVSLVPYMN